MRVTTGLLTMSLVVALGCRSSEETEAPADGATPDREVDAGRLEPIERDPPPADDADRWQRKIEDEAAEMEGRRRAARERDRRIDEEPIQQPPEAPPDQEPPPR